MMRDAMIHELQKRGFTLVNAQIKIDDILHFLDLIGYRPITKEGYEDWKRDVHFLAILEAHGVDNWGGWDQAVQEMGDD